MTFATFNDYIIQALGFFCLLKLFYLSLTRRLYLSSTTPALMTLLDKICIAWRNGRRCTWPVLGVPCVLLSALIIWILKVCTVEEFSPIIFGLESESHRYISHVTFSPLKLVTCTLRTNLMTLSSVIRFVTMITMTSYVMLLLWRRIRN